MKRTKILFLVVLLTVFASAGVFAQSDISLPGVNDAGNNPGMAVNVDLGYLLSGLLSGGFGIGGGFEFAVSDLIAVKIKGGFVTWSYLGYGASYIDVAGTARFYFLNTGLNGPFAGVGGGVQIMMFSETYFGASGTYVWPQIGAEAGYKFTLMNDAMSGFFVEPFLGFFYTIATVSGFTMGGLGGLGFGANLGWSF